ncbi:MAG: general secretion pathway protein GspK [Planctomycetes bacterium]|nr:general secretion pathway protein GspK [Planctomycetota bacterium]MBL7143927.1 general secretion pathway protein GspK [Phycisphaerae bacterium]
MRLKIASKEHSGFVLVVVLCMVIMLGILLFGFNYKSRTGLLAADDFRKFEQARNCARAGLNIAIAAVRNNEDLQTNRKLQNLFSGENTVSIDEGNCSITVTEESGKLNINLIRNKNGALNRAVIDQLLRLIDLLNRENFGDFHISYELVPSIIDWIDSDDEVTSLPFVKHENSGAESDYYSSLTPPYRCRNNSFETTEDLLLIKGVTQQVFSCLRDCITVRGDDKININWASKHVIQSLSESMDPVLAQMIMDRRKIKPFGSVMELREIPGLTDSIYQAIEKIVTVNSEKQYYRVSSKGTADGLSRTTVAVLARNMETENVDVILYKEL